ncbi:sterol glucosyltransferase [Aspergillus homomorphus CBS 101889]|uniref:Sterol glucosyltransferase n=1 Tax=Aspergillus homomorphus (strain CBS 101889) TaxID=1450537 RepID=A0A395I3K8_ASPHC|nr:sterol glucosyltransferase [Aspergillus homomorphus CBS 101889]RAL14296.1 sterol glucosyltransferase [Aspergillus homomorphus CBS 101889]
MTKPNANLCYEDLPPPYEVAVAGYLMEASGKSQEDGRIQIAFKAKRENIEALLPEPPREGSLLLTPPTPFRPTTPLNIVIQIVGSRGDVQPFVALGSRLQKDGHRVRIATHGTFKDFVQQAKLEFFSIGGDPEDLMSFMVKNPGIIPKMTTILSDEIGRKRKMIATMLNGCWHSCIDPDLESGHPFVADAIIANPPSFAHIHCAQALSVPLHIMFTMPWSPTRAFPHPLANIHSSGTDPALSNYLSYSMVELLTWTGLANIINAWRVKTLNIEELSPRTATGLMETLKVPHTYCWSPALIPRPYDWASHIDICGFFFREEPHYVPSAEIHNFLSGKPAPVYIGFGSIVMEDPVSMTKLIRDALNQLGIRAIVSRGWSNLGQGCADPNILFIDDCPHEWLFKHVAAVVHHGGAGTTASGLLHGRPTAIVPFFGDQPFWAQMVAAAGAGPSPINHKALTSRELTEAIKFCLMPSARNAAAKIANQMRTENGVSAAAQSFYRHIPWQRLQCDFLPGEKASWSISAGKGSAKISHKAMVILVQHKLLDTKKLKPYHTNEIRITKNYTDPLSATSAVLLGTMTDFTKGFGILATDPIHGVFQMSSSMVKGTLVQTPTALADGLRNVPRLYGDQPASAALIDGWKDGITEAGKFFYTGFAEGLTGIVTKPYREAKSDGAAGFAKGLAKGSVELFSKPGAAMFGLLAYPAMGIYKSLKKLRLNPTEARIVEAQMLVGDYMLLKAPATSGEASIVVSKYKELE